MGLIGNFGSLITFETSDRRILSFNDFKKDVSASTASHARYQQKPLTEFTGPELAKVTFTIQLNALHGVRPRDTMEAIERAIETGQTETLVIGGRQVGSGQWIITSASESWEHMYNGGELSNASMSLSLQEYF